VCFIRIGGLKRRVESEKGASKVWWYSSNDHRQKSTSCYLRLSTWRWIKF